MFQLTIGKTVSATGIGLHSGSKCTITLVPAPPNTGVVFVRGTTRIPAHHSNAVMTPLCTTLQRDGANVSTIEHLMAAVSACMIDNLVVVCDSDEIPIMDGSALPFMILLQEAGVVEQTALKQFMVITQRTVVSQGDRWAMVEPFDGLEYEMEIDFGHPQIDRSPRARFHFDGPSSFSREIARARTFGFLRDLESLRAQNLIQGASVDNAIVLTEHGVVNEEGLRFEDEFVRHKLLDAVGDMRLLGMNFLGRFRGFKTGHHLNLTLCQEVVTRGHLLVTSDPRSSGWPPLVGTPDHPFPTPG